MLFKNFAKSTQDSTWPKVVLIRSIARIVDRCDFA